MPEADDFPVVTEKSEARLSERHLVDYMDFRRQLIRWLITFGKNPQKVEGYAPASVQNHAYRTDKFLRWIWDQEGGYTLAVTQDHGDQYLTELAYDDSTEANKAKEYQSLLALYRWLEEARGMAPWNPPISFYEQQSTTQPRDFLTRKERTAIREAALEYGSIPSYGDVSPEERDRWKAYLAQRFEKPKSAVVPADWARANGWKTPSLVSASLDAGLRPVEVRRATPTWVDVDNRVLRIPRRESAKSDANWTVSLSDRTAQFLDRWLDQRETIQRYDETEALWLSQRGNPYQSGPLSYLLEQLCEIAGIDTENRQMSWYTIRHSVGTYMTREEGLGAAQMQLRHKRPETTMKYDQAPVEDRRDALNRMG